MFYRSFGDLRSRITGLPQLGNLRRIRAYLEPGAAGLVELDEEEEWEGNEGDYSHKPSDVDRPLRVDIRPIRYRRMLEHREEENELQGTEIKE